jgi:hypothetical protein
METFDTEMYGGALFGTAPIATLWGSVIVTAEPAGIAQGTSEHATPGAGTATTLAGSEPA